MSVPNNAVISIPVPKLPKRIKKEIPMEPMDNVRYILDAIHSVKIRAQKSLEAKEFEDYSNRIGDLYALEKCYLIETNKLFKETNKLFKEIA